MLNNDLKKLSRAQLLEIMIQQGKEIERLQKELNQANAALYKRELMLRKAGSIAEASLQLSDVFEQAQVAADFYLDNIKRMHAEENEIYERYEAVCQRKCDEIIEKTKDDCINLIAKYEQRYANALDDRIKQEDGGDAFE